jgi:hypothetical protein
LLFLFFRNIKIPGQTNKIEISGIIDPIIIFGISQSLDKQGKLRLGFSNWLTVPLGDYNTNKTANIGNNRWATKPESNLTYMIKPGLSLEITGSATFFSDNDSYTSTNMILGRKPLYAVETHISQDFNKQWRRSLSYFSHFGGETIINGVNQDNAILNHSAQVGLDWNFTPQWSTGVHLRSNFKVKNGFTNNIIRIKLSKLF